MGKTTTYNSCTDIEFCLATNGESYDLDEHEIIMYAHPVGHFFKEKVLSDQHTEGSWSKHLEDALGIEVDEICESTFRLMKDDESVLTPMQWKTDLEAQGLNFCQPLQDFIEACQG